jgi:hypothetical protein
MQSGAPRFRRTLAFLKIFWSMIMITSTNPPFYIEWDAFSVMAIAGNSGSGKTTTARLMLCQLVLNQVDIIVADPHGYNLNQSLTSAIKPLEHMFLVPIAIDKQDRIDALRYVYKQLEIRLQQKEKTHKKLTLVFDELTAHFIECSPQEIAEQERMLLRLANEGRRLNIRVLLIGQNWKQDFTGSRSVRSSINAVIFHRIAEDEIKLFAPSASTAIRRKIAALKPGYACIYGAGHTYTFVKIPQITYDDIVHFAESRKNHANKESRQNHDMNHAHSNAVNDTKIAYRDSVQNMPKSTEKVGITQQKIAHMHRCILDGMSKEQTIKTVFNISKGSKHKPWLAASKAYDRMLELMREQEG